MDETIKDAMLIEYCANCTLPTDYCEYSGCNRVLDGEGPGIEDCPEKCSSSTAKNSDSRVSGEYNSTENEESKNNKKKAKQNKVVIKVESRAKRKNVTVVTGLEHFNIPLNEAAKKFAKQFSCGASVVKGNNGKSDQIDVQGDFDTTIAEFIMKLYPHIEACNISIQ